MEIQTSQINFTNVDLSQINQDDLKRLATSIEKEQSRREKYKLSNTRREIERLCTVNHVTLNDLFPEKFNESVLSNKVVPVKYVSTSNPNNQWSGRGKQPIWLREEAEKEGLTIEEYKELCLVNQNNENSLKNSEFQS